MRHAAVCNCRDCGVARLTAIMEGMPDQEGRVTVAFAAFRLGTESLRVEDVALPYSEIDAVAERIDVLVERLRVMLDGSLSDPHSGPANELLEAILVETRVIHLSWAVARIEGPNGQGVNKSE